MSHQPTRDYEGDRLAEWFYAHSTEGRLKAAQKELDIYRKVLENPTQVAARIALEQYQRAERLATFVRKLQESGMFQPALFQGIKEDV